MCFDRFLLLLVDRLDLLELALSMPPLGQWAAMFPSNFLHHGKTLGFFKEWSLLFSFYLLSLPQYHHSTLLPSPAFIDCYTRLIGLISLSSPLQYYLSQTWDPTLPYHLSLLIPLRIYLAIGLCSIRCHARKPTCNCIPPGVRKCFSETGQCGKCQFRSGPSWTYDWKCEGPVYSDERHLQDVTLENWKRWPAWSRGLWPSKLSPCLWPHQNLLHDAGNIVLVSRPYLFRPVLCALQISRMRW